MTDDNNCSQIGNIEVIDAPELVVDIDITSDFDGDPISCPDASDGEVTVSSTGGTGNVIYFWSNSFNGEINSGLAEGIYFVTATDQNGCQAFDSIVLVDPQPITVDNFVLNNPTTCNGLDGSIEIDAIGGHGVYQYRISFGFWQNSNVFDNLGAGTYDFFVRNMDGTCETGPFTASIDDPIPLSLIHI